MEKGEEYPFVLMDEVDAGFKNDFIYYLSKTDWFRQNAVNSMVGVSGRQRANAKFVGKTKLLVSPLPTQRRIATILSAYDDLIENNLKRIKLLEEMAQKTYEEWFVRMKFPGHENAVFDEESGLPKGWKRVKWGEILEMNYLLYLLKNTNFINNDAAVPGLNRNAAYFIKCVIPKEKFLFKFESNIKPIFENIQNLKFQNQHLKEARDILLPRLMTGMIEVEKIEIKKILIKN